MRSRDRARRWLSADALYCFGAGALLISLSQPLGRLFHLPAWLLVGGGVATLAWASLVALLARRQDYRDPLRVVSTANVAATVGLSTAVAVAPISVYGKALLAAVAAEVAAFAWLQLATLRDREP
ncbi:MAG TPA: hypothetical protein VJT84_07670 [Gaiellaceae bacterium]|nr:hypothetical protein [Gaiellaceae bacterium]